MVLEKLGTSLKETLAKIARAVFVDENLINELVKDIQKALLKSDVNVKLVFDLSKKIKERALGEKAPSGITQKEHLIKIVYEELVHFLGEEGYKIDINKKPYKIMLVGLFGSGKCIHGESNVILSDGQVVSIKNLYSNYKKIGVEKNVKEGKIIDVTHLNINVPSYNPETSKIENKKATHLWKLKKETLLEVKLDNGNDCSVKVTPEHPFFVLRNGAIKKVRADNLNMDDVIAVPRSYLLKGNLISLKEEIMSGNFDVLVKPSLAKKQILSRFSNIKEACKNLKYPRDYCKFTRNLKLGKIPIQFYNLNEPYIKLKKPTGQKQITFPTHLTAELGEFLGYVLGDGNIYNNYVQISNEDKEIIERIVYLSQHLFCISPILRKDKRTNSMYNIILSSITLVELLKMFNLTPGKKGRNLKIPNQILISREEVVIPFLRAYFDCDSYSCRSSREIELSSESRILLQQVRSLLLRFKICTTLSKKIMGGKEYFRLFIRGKYAETYANKIGYLIERKQKNCSQYNAMGIIQGCGKQDMLPIGLLLKSLRLALGFSIGEIQENAVTNYGQYEEKGMISREGLLKLVDYYNLNGLGNLYRFLQDITKETNIKGKYSSAFINGICPTLIKEEFIIKKEQQIILTNKGEELISNIDNYDSYLVLINLLNLATSDVCWLPLEDIKEIKNDEVYVYDMTVEDNHSFIAENIIVHNTTQAGKLAKFFQKKGYKICLVQTDTWRAAAYEQLKTLGKQINASVFGNPKEKDPVKIYREFKEEINKFDVVIVDTAGRDALSDELIREIKKINTEVAPNECLLVLSGDIGQTAEKQASAFHSAVGVTGLIITKMDGTAKGGGALAGAAITEAPVKFIGVGEKIDDLEIFDPKRFVSRILGMGDLETLLEKAREVVSEEKAEDMQEKLLKGEFSLVDLYEQMGAMKKMGPLSKVLEMIPGMGSMKLPTGALEGQEEKMETWKNIMNSMTKAELENPDDILDASRIERIAQGAGTTTNEVRELLKQYRQSKKLVKMMKGQDPSKLMKKFKGKIPGM